MAKKQTEKSKSFQSVGKKGKRKFLKLTAKQWTIIGVTIGLISLVLIFKEEIFSLVSCENRQVVNATKTDSLYYIIKDQATPRVNTLVVIHKEESSGTVQNAEYTPTDSVCVVVYLKGDPRSEKDANTVSDYLTKALEEKFMVLPKDTFWFRMNFQVNSTDIDTGSNVLVWINNAENKGLGNEVYYRISRGLYVLDSIIGKWVRADTLPLNKAGSKVVFADVQPETLMVGKFALHNYPVAVIIPPYPFYKQAVQLNK